MTSRLVKRVEKLETQKKELSWIPVRLFKFAMDVRRMPPDKRKIQFCYNLKEPDFETCRKFGQRNIEAIKAVRPARLKGKSIFKIIRAIL